MHDDSQILSEARAAAVWQRAAQLQAEAAQRGEEHAHHLQALAGAEAPGDAGYRVADVRAAAVQAGISPEFVTLALVESASEDARGFDSERGERLATRLLGTSQRSIEIVRRIAAEPAAVLDGMKRVLPAPPYLLALADTVGPDPLNGGVLVFDVPAYNGSPLSYGAMAVGIKQLRLVLRTVDEGRGTELSVAADLRRATRHNFVASAALSGITGALGGAGGAALGAGALALGALAALPAAAGVAIVAPAITYVYGGLYRHFIRQLTGVLEGMLRGVEAHVRTGGAFAPPPRRGGPDDGGTFAALSGVH